MPLCSHIHNAMNTDTVDTAKKQLCYTSNQIHNRLRHTCTRSLSPRFQHSVRAILSHFHFPCTKFDRMSCAALIQLTAVNGPNTWKHISDWQSNVNAQFRFSRRSVWYTRNNTFRYVCNVVSHLSNKQPNSIIIFS